MIVVPEGGLSVCPTVWDEWGSLPSLQSYMLARSASLDRSTKIEHMSSDAEWPAHLQKALESALQATRALPSAERWDAVAERVPGKSKAEWCARAVFRATAPEPSALMTPSLHPPSPRACRSLHRYKVILTALKAKKTTASGGGNGDGDGPSPKRS